MKYLLNKQLQNQKSTITNHIKLLKKLKTIEPKSKYLNNSEKSTTKEKNIREKPKEKSYTFSLDSEHISKPKKISNRLASKSNDEWMAEESQDIYSCCQVADSLCAYPQNGCQAYIECDGHVAVLKNCPPNTIFDGYTKVCVEKIKSSYHCPIENDFPFQDKNDDKKIIPLDTKSNDPTIPRNINLIFSQNNHPENKHFVPRIAGNNTDHLRGVLREAWFNIQTNNDSIETLTNDERYPNFPDEYLILEKFDAPPNVGDFYGQRLSCYYLVL